MKIRKPQDKAKSGLQSIAKVDAGIWIEQPLQSSFAALQQNFDGLVRIFAFVDPSRFVFRISSLRGLLQFGQPETRLRQR